MDLRFDTVSFLEPYNMAKKNVIDACQSAAKLVKGSANRTEKAEWDAQCLRQFWDELKQRHKDGSFAELPGLRRGWRSIPHCHYLTVGIWRGIFVVSPETDSALALVFTREPHSYLDRLNELEFR